MSLGGRAAIVGVAKSDLGEVGPGFTPLDLMGQATLRTLDDAGLEKGDVYDLFSASAYYRMLTLSIGGCLGIRPRYSDATNLGGSSFVSNLFHAAAAESGPRAYSMAGVRPEDVNVAKLYDAFTINTLLFLEDLGFCEKGEGGAFVSGGRISPGGELAMNTNGGCLSYNHPGMYGLLLLVEAVRQIRKECGDRQLANANVALAHGNAGVFSSQVPTILGSGAAL